MTKFSGHIVLSSQKLALDDDSHSESIGNADEHEVIGRRIDAGACSPQLRERAGASGVFDRDRKSERHFERLEQREIVPAQTWREEHATASAIDHAGHHDADACTLAEFLMIGKHPSNSVR